jgi:hypothetical protein
MIMNRLQRISKRRAEKVLWGGGMIIAPKSIKEKTEKVLGGRA